MRKNIKYSERDRQSKDRHTGKIVQRQTLIWSYKLVKNFGEVRLQLFTHYHSILTDYIKLRYVLVAIVASQAVSWRTSAPQQPQLPLAAAADAARVAVPKLKREAVGDPTH